MNASHRRHCDEIVIFPCSKRVRHRARSAAKREVGATRRVRVEYRVGDPACRPPSGEEEIKGGPAIRRPLLSRTWWLQRLSVAYGHRLLRIIPSHCSCNGFNYGIEFNQFHCAAPKGNRTRLARARIFCEDRSIRTIQRKSPEHECRQSAPEAVQIQPSSPQNSTAHVLWSSPQRSSSRTGTGASQIDPAEQLVYA